MMHIFKELVKIYGVNPSITFHYSAGQDVYKHDREEIHVYCNPATPYPEHVFTLLHEYRHALQCAMGLFPEMLDMDTFHAMKARTEHYRLPWEVEANNWAWRKGLEMGFWDKNWKPSFLYGYPVGDLK